METTSCVGEILIRGYLHLKQILSREKKVFLELNYSKTDK